MAKKQPSSVRKDGFFSYFNPLNWFKWSKEKKLAGQAAKAIADPGSAPGFTFTAAHKAALNTTHGQKILKSAAKANLKAERDPMNKLHFRREEEKRAIGHVRRNLPDRLYQHKRSSKELERVPPSQWTAADRLGYSLDSGPDPDTAQIMSTFKPQSYNEWSRAEAREEEKNFAAAEKRDRGLARSAWGRGHARAFRDATKNVTPETLAAARHKHEANRAAAPLLRNNLDLPPIMQEMWGQSSAAAQKSRQWVAAMRPHVPALNNGAKLPWGSAFGATEDGFEFEDDRVQEERLLSEPEQKAARSFESVHSSGGKQPKAMEKVNLGERGKLDDMIDIKLQKAQASFDKQWGKKKAHASIESDDDNESEDRDSVDLNGQPKGYGAFQNFLYQQAGLLQPSGNGMYGGGAHDDDD